MSAKLENSVITKPIDYLLPKIREHSTRARLYSLIDRLLQSHLYMKLISLLNKTLNVQVFCQTIVFSYFTSNMFCVSSVLNFWKFVFHAKP